MKKRNLGLVLALTTILTTVSVTQKALGFIDKVSNALSEIQNQSDNSENNNSSGGEQLNTQISNIQ